VAGNLTIRDVTKPITVVLEHVGTASGEQGTKTGFDGSFTINRHDYGVSYGPGGIGDDVQIFVALEANKQ
jgi:polyisoprenoid-binding protein YceI